MPSSYTTLIRLEDLATGENDGTWGEKVDNNFLMVEQAIAGVASITLSSTSYSLTAANASTDEARKAVLVFSGTPGGTCTVTAPAVSHVWFVINGTNQSIVLKPLAGSGVTIPAGTNAGVYTDGSAAGFVQTYFSGSTLNGVTIGGTTPAAATFTNLTATGTINFVGGTVSNLGTVTTADINGGTVDGAVIGGASAAAGSFTTLSTSGAATLASASVTTTLSVTGNLTAAGIVVGTNARGTRTVSTTSTPTGGSDGDLWFVVPA